MSNGGLKEYSLAEVKVNNGRNGNPLWLVINDKVYDVTKFADKNQHPGGTDVLADVGGKDATNDYNEVGHSKLADMRRKSYYIGVLIEADRKTPSKSSSKSKAENEKRSCISIITCGLCG